MIALLSTCGQQMGGGKDNRDIVLLNNYTNDMRNRLLVQDIKFFAQELPRRHKNPFSILSEQEFYSRVEELIAQVDTLDNIQVFVELNKIVAAIGDAHTGINYWDGYGYPFRLWMFDGQPYIVDVDKSLAEMLHARIVKIGDMGIDEILPQLSSLIAHDNESWLLATQSEYLSYPVFLYGLGIIEDESSALFAVEKDGRIWDVAVPALESGEYADFVVNSRNDVLTGLFGDKYSYNYFPGYNALHFAYNACENMRGESFKDFNAQMFQVIEDNAAQKIIVDLRSNGGGSSEILNPFTQQLKQYVAQRSGVEVYILVGRKTFSSAMFAIYQILEAAPDAITVGEPTGGSKDHYGEVKSFALPNSQLPVYYSIKYFELGKDFAYQNSGVGTFMPDILLSPTMEDYLAGNDIVLDYALQL